MEAGISCLDTTGVNAQIRLRTANPDTQMHFKTANANLQRRGRIPITKNISVVDEQGNEYEATWPRRARGLVKNGRARFLSENKICLACPPNIILEDKEMADNTSNMNTEGSMMNNTGNGNTSADNGVKFDITWLFRQIAAIQQQTEYLNMAIENLSKMGDGDRGHQYSPGNIAGKAKAEAFAEIVRCRETTNQQILRFYETVYNDLKSGVFHDSMPEVESVLKSYD